MEKCFRDGVQRDDSNNYNADGVKRKGRQGRNCFIFIFILVIIASFERPMMIKVMRGERLK